jgi:hypothetical protein
MDAKQAYLTACLQKELEPTILFNNILDRIQKESTRGNFYAIYPINYKEREYVPEMIEKLEELEYKVEFFENLKYFGDYIRIEFPYPTS